MTATNKETVVGAESNQQPRELLERSVLLKLSSVINSSLDLENIMGQLMNILHQDMGLERATLTLLDPDTNELSIQLAHGLDEDEIKRGKYQVGEGITGRVVQAGEPMAIPDVDKEPLFLNRTGSRDIKHDNFAFICVPVKLDEKTVGALSIDCQFLEGSTLDEELRFMTIISSMVAQAVRIHQLVEKEKEQLKSENRLLKSQLKSHFHPKNMIGESKRMRDVYASIELVSPTAATVLLRGESGTGKEMVAHAIHYSSPRADGPFIKVSCAALPETLLESELFGYEKGAFTGATARKAGRFEMANNGTLFLDEIGDISASTQIKLLRVLQEKEFERVGGTETVRTNMRLVAATNRDLEAMVKKGDFREDLYYRLNVIPMFLPSLKERKEDIPLLVNSFLEKVNKENAKNIRNVSAEAMDYLMNYSWPGNVRELENAITRAVVLCQKDIITPDLLPIPGNQGMPSLSEAASVSKASSEDEEVEGTSLTERVENLEKNMIRDVLDQTGGSQRKTAKILGITERILGYKIKKYGLKVD